MTSEESPEFDRRHSCKEMISIAAVLLLIVGCERGDSEYFGTTAPRHPPDELCINNYSEPQWIDPGRCADGVGGDVVWNIFAGLVEFHPVSLEPIPDIAKSWEVSEDGLIYTFHLRESVWSDGTPLTAHDFEWSWKRVLDPKLGSKYVGNMYLFANGEARTTGALYVSKLPDNASAREIEAINDACRAVSDSLNNSIDATVDRVERVNWPELGAMVYLKGSTDKKTILRDELKRAIRERFSSEVNIRVADDSIVGIRAIDDYTLETRLRNPVPYFLRFVSFYTFLPVPRHVIEKLERQGINPNYWTRPEHIVSNGAYQLREWRFRQHMVFEVNPRYWNSAHPKLCRIRKITTPMVESYNTCLNLYYAGEIDYPGSNVNLPAELLDRLTNYKDYRFDPYLAVYFFWLNVDEPPLDNVKVRQALSLAIDREQITKYVTRGGQIPTRDLVPDGVAGYEGLKRSIFNPDHARKLLAEAGYPDGKGLPEITLKYNTSESHKQIAVSMQQMWKKNLNIDVIIENLEWQVHMRDLKAHRFQIGRLGWIADYSDPFTFLELLTTKCGNNHSNWSNAEYDHLIEKANQTSDANQRLQIFRQAEAIAMSEQPIIPIYVYTRPMMVKPYLKGLWGNYLDRHQWKYCWIDERWYDGIPETVVDDPPPPETTGYAVQ